MNKSKRKTSFYIALMAMAGIMLFVAGCSSAPKELVSKAKERVEALNFPNNKPDVKKPVSSRGEPKPVTLVNEASQESFDPASVADSDVLTLTMSYKVAASGHANAAGVSGWGRRSKVVITTLIPKTVEGKQKVLSTDFNVKSTKVFDLGDNRYAQFDIENAKQDFTIQVMTKIKLFRYDLTIALNNKAAPALSDKELKEYLKAEKYIETGDPTIKALAQQVKGADEMETLNKTYRYVTKNMIYDMQKVNSTHWEALGAAKAAQAKKGVCVEFADLFVALCRANGIPTRSIGGITTERTDATKGHAWVEAYTKKYGWIPFDPTWGQSKGATFYKLRPSYIYLSDVRNDDILNNADIFGYSYYGVPVDIGYSASITSYRADYLNSMMANINKYKPELNQMKSRLDAFYAATEVDKAQIKQTKSSIEQVKSQLEAAKGTDIVAYDSLVTKHNDLVATYNSQVAAFNKKVSEYETMRKAYEAKRQEENSLIEQYNNLN
ncbi:MAG: transglutaminase-like domain-containing protein [Candidatus Aquicultor sp.]